MHQASLQSLNHACSFDDDLDSLYRRFYADELGIQKSKERARQFVLRSLQRKARRLKGLSDFQQAKPEMWRRRASSGVDFEQHAAAKLQRDA